MEQPETYRSKPTEIQAIRWTGDNVNAVQRFARDCFFALSDQERRNADDPTATAMVYDRIHSTWILVHTDQWIIRGTKGEHYPCDPEVFAEKYEWTGGCGCA